MLLRLGIPHTQELEESWIKQIREGSAPLVEQQSNRVSVYDISVLVYEVPTPIHVVYDSKRRSVVTVLFPGGPVI